MSENPLFWPQVEMEEVNPQWWDEVMKSTSIYSQHINPDLSDREDFTIRAMVHLIATRSQEDLEWFFEDSLQKERVMGINALVRSKDKDEKEKGREGLIKLIEDYTEDILREEK